MGKKEQVQVNVFNGKPKSFPEPKAAAKVEVPVDIQWKDRDLVLPKADVYVWKKGHVDSDDLEIYVVGKVKLKGAEHMPDIGMLKREIAIWFEKICTSMKVLTRWSDNGKED